ncbi:MAG: DUF4197 domain-containing protein [Zoogloeaceae bacterium]|nr:DUF4197 domain-containing protein [Zoogloeaceae bacterium]
MLRLTRAFAAVLLLTGCTGGLDTLQQDLARTAQEQVLKTLAGHYTRALGSGVGTIVDELSRPGGYLDNPLIRILLPPPVMLALDIARELHGEPQADLLEVLVNRAAEQAIPGAAPILQAAIAQLTPGEARTLLDAGTTAGTDYLKAKTLTALREALGPQIGAALDASGALRSYAALLEAPAQPTPPVTAPPGEPPADIAADTLPDPSAPPAPPTLEDYVTEQAIDGLFKALAEEEARIRAEIDSIGLKY